MYINTVNNLYGEIINVPSDIDPRIEDSLFFLYSVMAIK